MEFSYARFRNPLMIKEDNRPNEAYGDMPPLDFNSNTKWPPSSEPNEQEAHAAKCTCQRPQSTIFCYKCGFVFSGRMRIKCERHPKVILLMDKTNCPSCKSVSRDNCALPMYMPMLQPFLGQYKNQMELRVTDFLVECLKKAGVAD